MPRKLIDLSNEFTPEFFKNKHFKKGSVLIFSDEGKKSEFKIVQLNRKRQICKVEEVKLYTEDEINAMDREDAEELIKNG